MARRISRPGEARARSGAAAALLPIPCGVVRGIVLAAIAISRHGRRRVGVLASRRGDSGDVTAFFTLPTPRSVRQACSRLRRPTPLRGVHGRPGPGGVRRQVPRGHRYVAKWRLTAVPVSEDDFYLTERPGKEHPPAALADAATSWLLVSSRGVAVRAPGIQRAALRRRGKAGLRRRLHPSGVVGFLDSRALHSIPLECASQNA